MTQETRKDARLSKGPGQQVDKAPPPPSTLSEERENPGLNAKGTGGAGAPRPAPGSRTRDQDVGDRLDDGSLADGKP